MTQNEVISQGQPDQIVSQNTKNTPGLIGFILSLITFALVLLLVVSIKSKTIDGGAFIGILICSSFFAIPGLILNIIGLKKAKKNSMRTSLYVLGILFSLTPPILYAYMWISY